MEQIEVIFDSFDDAFKAFYELHDILIKDKFLDYKDFHELLFKGETMNNKYLQMGWSSLFDAKVKPINETGKSWAIIMPDLEDKNNLEKESN